MLGLAAVWWMRRRRTGLLRRRHMQHRLLLRSRVRQDMQVDRCELWSFQGLRQGKCLLGLRRHGPNLLRRKALLRGPRTGAAAQRLGKYAWMGPSMTVGRQVRRVARDARAAETHVASPESALLRERAAAEVCLAPVRRPSPVPVEIAAPLARRAAGPARARSAPARRLFAPVRARPSPAPSVAGRINLAAKATPALAWAVA